MLINNNAMNDTRTLFHALVLLRFSYGRLEIVYFRTQYNS